LRLLVGRGCVRNTGELQRLQHRLLVLQLVLQDEAVHIRAAHERIGLLELRVLENSQRVTSNALEVGARLRRCKNR